MEEYAGMADRTSSVPTLTADILLKAYAVGMFPMAENADDPNLFWIEPEWRGIIPLDGFRIPRRLARTVRKDGFDMRVDTDFHGVVDGCATPAPGARKTWINATIRKLYGELFRRGHCHTVESWKDGQLVGGLYGVSIGGAFFGESMFSTVTDASKVALVHLVARLRAVAINCSTRSSSPTIWPVSERPKSRSGFMGNVWRRRSPRREIFMPCLRR